MNTEQIINAYNWWKEGTTRKKPTRNYQDLRFGQWFINEYSVNTCYPFIFYEECPHKALLRILNDPLFNEDCQDANERGNKAKAT